MHRIKPLDTEYHTEIMALRRYNLTCESGRNSRVLDSGQGVVPQDLEDGSMRGIRKREICETSSRHLTHCCRRSP